MGELRCVLQGMREASHAIVIIVAENADDGVQNYAATPSSRQCHVDAQECGGC